MSEEQENTEQNTEQTEAPKELSVEQSLTLLVNLARQSKLSYDEHAIVDRAVRTLSIALNLKT